MSIETDESSEDSILEGKKEEEERNNQLTKDKRQNSKDADESSNEIHEKYQKFHHIMKTNKKKQ